jgi:hypothetical protein
MPVISYGDELLALHPNPKLEDLPLSAVRDCLFSIGLPVPSAMLQMPTEKTKESGTKANRFRDSGVS